MKYYRKEIPDQAIYVFGQPFRFDILATEEVPLIHELDKCIAKQRGGVIAITQEEYEVEVKKKATEQLLRNASQPHRPELKSSNLNLQPERRVAEAVVNPGGSRQGMFARQQMDRQGIAAHRQQELMPDPIQIPSPNQFITPPTAKLSEMKK
jgi:hypothetical protein